jgi:L-fuconolactonase
MLTVDSQVHAYERNHPGRPWVGTLYGPAEVTGDQMVAAMDAVGVDGAILVSPFSMHPLRRQLCASGLCGAPDPLQAGQTG